MNYDSEDNKEVSLSSPKWYQLNEQLLAIIIRIIVQWEVILSTVWGNFYLLQTYY